MDFEAGSTYRFDLDADLGLFGKRPVCVMMTLDSPTAFHGYAYLAGKPLKLLGFEIDETMRLVFDQGTIDGADLSFTVEDSGIEATFSAHVADDGSVTGSGNAGGLLRLKLKGTVAKAE